MKSAQLFADASALWFTRSVCWWLGALLCAHAAMATELTVTLHDAGGAAVDQAVVALYPSAPPAAPSPPSTLHTLDQIKKQFVPRLLAIHTGDQVRFPNSDNIRHHVYSFSPARKFELPLYAGVPAEPVTFDKAGKVVLGCNIHDRMSAHIYVLDTSVFAVTEAGHHTFSGLPPGDYELAVFHPQQSEANDGARQPLHVTTAAAQSVDVGLELQPVKTADEQGLSPLELKFRQLRHDTP